MGCLLHKSLSSLAKLLLSSEHLVLIGGLNQRHDVFSVNLNIASVYELEEALQNLGLNIGYGNFSLGTLHEGTIEHLLKNVGACSKDLTVCKYTLSPWVLSRDNHYICEFLAEHNLFQIPRHDTRIVHLVPELR